jgi:riboflavin synthase
MSCHEHAIKDFDLQLEMNGLQMEMLMEDGKVLDYHMSEYEDLEQKKLKLLVGKRFHQNASNAYWYWTQREKSGK